MIWYQLIVSLLMAFSPVQPENTTYTSSPPPHALGLNDDIDSYMARYREWLASVPEHQRAWPIIQSVDTLLQSELGDLELVTDSLNPALSNEWKDSVAFVQNHPQLLEQLRSIATKTQLGMPAEELRSDPPDPIDHFPPVLSTLLPQIGMIKTQAKLLIIDAQIANSEGDHNRVLNDINAIMTLSQITSILNSMIGGLVSISTENLVSNAILSNKMDLDQWSEEELAQLAAEYDKSPGWYPASQFFDGERAMYQLVINWVYIDNKDGRLSRQGEVRFQNFTACLDEDTEFHPADESDLLSFARWRNIIGKLSDQTSLFDEFQFAGVEDVALPIFNRRHFSSEQFQTKMLESEGFNVLPVGLLVSDGPKFVTRIKHAQADRDATKLLIALYQHRARHAQFPLTISQIDADFNIPHPIDPYSGDDLKYIIIDDRPVIYSVGPDRNDDGGMPIQSELGKPDRYPEFILLDELESILDINPTSIDGDWILTQ